MKSLLIPLLFVIISCSDKKEKDSPISEPVAPETSGKPETVEPPDSALISWMNHYRKENPGFDDKNFVLISTSAISYNPSNVVVVNAKGFNKIYKPFLVFNENKTKYLDYDSYHWFVSKDGSASFEADQQVALVDMKEKSAVQIAFFGPSYRIEEAFWQADSTAVLLGNSQEKVPFMMKFNFPRNTVQHFQSRDTLKFEVPYSQIRLGKFGIKTN